MLRRVLFLGMLAGAVIAVKKKMGHDEAGTDA
jgi:hypothetical protein